MSGIKTIARKVSLKPVGARFVNFVKYPRTESLAD